MTNDNEWAERAFEFKWGQSQLAERLRALEELVGTQADLVRLAGIEGTAYKMALKRGSSQPIERIAAIARATAVTLDYLAWGVPMTARDGECEEKRFDIAAREFALPSSPDRRESRSLLIAQCRLEVEANINRLADAGFDERFRVASYSPPPEGFVLLAPLLPRVIREGRGFYTEAESAPIALSIAWLDREGLKPGSLRFVTIRAGEGGPEFPAGTTVLIDCDQVAPTVGGLFAMNIGGEPQLRRVVQRLSAQTQLVHVHASWPPEEVDEPADAPIMGTVIFSFKPV